MKRNVNKPHKKPMMPANGSAPRHPARGGGEGVWERWGELCNFL